MNPVFNITKSSLEWIKDILLYNGKLFDVVLGEILYKTIAHIEMSVAVVK